MIYLNFCKMVKSIQESQDWVSKQKVQSQQLFDITKPYVKMKCKHIKLGKFLGLLEDSLLPTKTSEILFYKKAKQTLTIRKIFGLQRHSPKIKVTRP